MKQLSGNQKRQNKKKQEELAKNLRGSLNKYFNKSIHGTSENLICDSSNEHEQHENSIEHLTNLRTCTELQVRLNKNKTIDKDLQEQIKKDKQHWKHVMLRIISVVKCLATHNLAFRGTH